MTPEPEMLPGSRYFPCFGWAASTACRKDIMTLCHADRGALKQRQPGDTTSPL